MWWAGAPEEEGKGMDDVEVWRLGRNATGKRRVEEIGESGKRKDGVKGGGGKR